MMSDAVVPRTCATPSPIVESATAARRVLQAAYSVLGCDGSLFRWVAPRLIRSTASRRLIAPKGEPPVGFWLP
jgi:hypothetical protein